MLRPRPAVRGHTTVRRLAAIYLQERAIALQEIFLEAYDRRYANLLTPQVGQQILERAREISHHAVYAQKSAPGTGILFIKVPPGNDKVPVDTNPEVEAWSQEPIRFRRIVDGLRYPGSA